MKIETRRKICVVYSIYSLRLGTIFNVKYPRSSKSIFTKHGKGGFSSLHFSSLESFCVVGGGGLVRPFPFRSLLVPPSLRPQKTRLSRAPPPHAHLLYFSFFPPFVIVYIGSPYFIRLVRRVRTKPFLRDLFR